MPSAFIYRRGGLGDTLLLFPVFEILKREGYHITASGNRDYLRLALKIGWIDRIVAPEVTPSDELTVDLKIIIGINGNLHPFPSRREWILQYYLRSLGLEGKGYSLRLPFGGEVTVKGDGSGILDGRVVIHPSSGSRKKSLPPILFMKLKEIFPDALFVAGEADGWISHCYLAPSYVTPVFFDHDIVRTALSLRGARLFIGADSGLAHLSAYLGVPTVIIYGPSDPVIWRPVGERIIQLRPSECSPCFPDVCEGRYCLDDKKIIEEILSSISKLRL